MTTAMAVVTEATSAAAKDMAIAADVATVVPDTANGELIKGHIVYYDSILCIYLVKQVTNKKKSDHSNLTLTNQI